MYKEELYSHPHPALFGTNNTPSPIPIISIISLFQSFSMQI